MKRTVGNEWAQKTTNKMDIPKGGLHPPMDGM